MGDEIFNGTSIRFLGQQESQTLLVLYACLPFHGMNCWCFSIANAVFDTKYFHFFESLE